MSGRGTALDVAMNGERVARWTVSRGEHELTYASEWLGSPEARALSRSLPLLPADRAHRGPPVEHWFENLLPDDPAMRERMRRRYEARSSATIDLLAAAGRDCVGAVQLLADGEPPTPLAPARGEPLDEAGVAAVLRNARAGTPLGREDADGFRLSLAGAQEKTALTLIDGVWNRPVGATPTTHILKLPLGRVAMTGVDLSTSIANEHFCARLLAALGLPVAETRLERFEDQEALIVTRFDRRLATDGETVLRLPQEDCCQALGLSRERKYEADGGPGIETLLALWAGSRRPAEDRRTFLLASLVFWTLGAIDGHAKNFSLFLGRGDRYAMAPLYDVLSVWPYVDSPSLPRQRVRFAMGWHGRNRHDHLTEIRPRHIAATIERAGMTLELPGLLSRLARTLPDALQNTVTTLGDSVPSTVSGPIAERTETTLRRLVDAAP